MFLFEKMKTGDKKRREKCENIIFSWFFVVDFGDILGGKRI